MIGDANSYRDRICEHIYFFFWMRRDLSSFCNDLIISVCILLELKIHVHVLSTYFFLHFVEECLMVCTFYVMVHVLICTYIFSNQEYSGCKYTSRPDYHSGYVQYMYYFRCMSMVMPM